MHAVLCVGFVDLLQSLQIYSYGVESGRVHDNSVSARPVNYITLSKLSTHSVNTLHAFTVHPVNALHFLASTVFRYCNLLSGVVGYLVDEC